MTTKLIIVIRDGLVEQVLADDHVEVSIITHHKGHTDVTSQVQSEVCFINESKIKSVASEVLA